MTSVSHYSAIEKTGIFSDFWNGCVVKTGCGGFEPPKFHTLNREYRQTILIMHEAEDHQYVDRVISLRDGLLESAGAA